MKIDSPEKLKKLQDKAKKAEAAKDIFITMCGGTGCQGSGCQKVIDKLNTEITDRGLEDKVGVKVTGCQGFCEQGPLMVIRPQGVFYMKLEPEDIPTIFDETVEKGDIVDDLLYTEPVESKKIEKEVDIPFYKNQKRVVFKNNGFIDPTSLDDYLSRDGYSSLEKVLYEMEPDDVINEVIDSGLRGRGGAGFPTGKKWQFTRQEDATPKYIICNSDEGDPGAYMDRSILEGNPHLVLEGMLIAAYAIGASRGFIYVRAEYPLAVTNIKKAAKKAEEMGFLGDNVLGSDFSFELEIMEGAGAFVCGEETALLASIEGKRGMPRTRPPYPAQSGLWGKPTNINNVETFSNVPLIIKEGSEWFSSIGTEGSSGTKIFSLVGKVNNTGLIEVPMGVTIREIVFDIGGGIPGGKKVKAVQTGGPSGGCIPEDMFDLQVDFDKLNEAGSMMGSGGMVVMDEDTCMVDVAKFFLEFMQDESCGKCLPCRDGVPEMYKILEKITKGEGTDGDIANLRSIAETIKSTALCGLGNTSPNPVLSTLEYYEEEYRAHIHDKACPAGVCADLIYYEVQPDDCKSCDRCRKACPVDAISGEPGGDPYIIDNDICISCGTCIEECPFDAIEIIPGQEDK